MGSVTGYDPAMRLRNDKVLVFGGGSGIGKAIARRLLNAGADVVIAGRNEEKLRACGEELSSDRLRILAADITDIDRHADVFGSACEMMGGVTAFVNSAGDGSSVITGRGYEPWDITEKEWDIISGIDEKAAFFLMRNEIDYLRARGIRGNILNIASNAACMDVIGAYGAAKLAVIQWTRAFGKRYGHDGIIINGIAPGGTVTDMISHYGHDFSKPYPRHAIERFIRPEEIAELAFYLMSNYGEVICGHTVVADGGDNAAN